MQIDRDEFLRYLGWNGQKTEDTLLQKLDEAAKKCLALASPRSVARKFRLTQEGELAGTGFFLQGQDIRKHLSGCREIYLLAATIGQGVERAVSVAENKSAHEALLLDTAASCAVESYCDDIGEDLQKNCPTLLTPRFSCGYGDFPIQAQREICALLRTDSQIGLCCDESFLLTPRKSVTAFIGITDLPRTHASARGCGNKCASCKHGGCAFRKRTEP